MATVNSTEVKENIVMPYERTGDFFVEDLGEIEKKPFYSFVKRAVDIIFSVFALILLALPMVVTGLVIRCTSNGSALYFQDRLGLGGKKITIVKFRTMYVDAEKNGAQWSSGDADVRVTRFGRFLRRTHLDEIPQFWCVLKGDMSIVGPRPEREMFYNEFEKYIHGFSERLKVRPGLTGLAQVNGGYSLRPEEKIVYDVEYIKNRSFWQDIKIIFMTVKVVLCRDSAK